MISSVCIQLQISELLSFAQLSSSLSEFLEFSLPAALPSGCKLRVHTNSAALQATILDTIDDRQEFAIRGIRNGQVINPFKVHEYENDKILFFLDS